MSATSPECSEHSAPPKISKRRPTLRKMKTLPEPAPPVSTNLLKFTLPCPFSVPPELSPTAGKETAPKTRILVAEDDPVSSELICARLTKWGYEVISTQNGTEAMTVLRRKDAPSLAILDWMMPGLDGLEVCRRVREADRVLYIILLTARGRKENIVEGLTAGADDYLIKPFDKEELHARILVGLRVMDLQAALAERVQALEWASGEIRSLRSQLPI
jgi:sigma-B regulation protein RsbU (phosphoserine phosphatase)